MKQHAGIVARWLVFGGLVGVGSGVGSAVFLYTLGWATSFRDAHEAIVYTLPIAGLLVGLCYARWGTPIRGGNNLVLDTIHEGGAPLPLRMGPMVLVGTVLTHLFGGSAGREGTAVQMGASLADALSARVALAPALRRQLLAAGIAGGFGSVFGTPIAGFVFGLEVITIGRFELAAFLPALIASFVGDQVTRALGVVHTAYPHPAALSLTPSVVGKWLLFSIAVAASATIFVELTHRLKKLAERVLPSLPLRMLLGGATVVGLWKLVGDDRYLGLGIPTIVAAFSSPLPPYAFALKMLFTAVTLAVGFLGGEVTPLFFVGATLGAALSAPLGLPLALCAGVGLASVFAAAARTPLALSLMAVELLGPNVLPHVAITAVVAYLLSRRRGIYSAQRRP